MFQKENPCKTRKIVNQNKKTKLFLFKLLILVGPNKSMWINSNDLDVMISLIAVKEDLVYFSSWHASQMRSFLNFK